MALVIMGWKLRVKEAKMRKHPGSLLKIYHPPTHFSTGGGGALPVLQARVLGNGDIKGEVTFPSSASRPGKPILIYSKQPILQTRSLRPRDRSQLAQGHKNSALQDRELDRGAQST